MGTLVEHIQNKTSEEIEEWMKHLERKSHSQASKLCATNSILALLCSELQLRDEAELQAIAS